MAWRSYIALLRCLSISKIDLQWGATYVIAGESKNEPSSGKSRHPLATSFSAIRVDVASTREVQWVVMSFGAGWR
jgi:hypothetical protein